MPSRYRRNSSSTPESSERGGTAAEFEATTIDTVLFIALPLTPQFSLFIKGGIYRWDLDRTVTPGNVKTTTDGTDQTWGMGAKYNLSSNFTLRFDWQRYKYVGDPAVTGKADMEVYLIGVVFKF